VKSLALGEWSVFPVNGNFKEKASRTGMIAAILWQTGSGGAGSSLGMFLPMLIVMGIFYVMLILPQQRQRKKTQAMLAALKNGDKVVTTGGIYGTVNGFDGEVVILRIAEQVKIRIARSAIAQVEATEDAK
jgi:preprotein translocase subunit YajC